MKKLSLFLFLALLVSGRIYSQGGSVSGKVTDAASAPLEGVTVTVEETKKTTSTDQNGNFSIQAQQEQTLTFSYVGTESKTIKIADVGARLNIQLNVVGSTLGDVVVIGYGTVKKSDLTGSVSSIKSADFNKGVNSSVDQAIIGRAAGVNIRQTSAEPGGGMSIRIRGASSINAGNEPLYVIDGMPIDNSSTLSLGGGAGTDPNPNPANPLVSLNPDDIASIEILKDASATAIYGSRGANGVILITTKKGVKGKSQIGFGTSAGAQSASKLYNVLSAPEYMKTLNDISVEQGQPAIFSAQDISRIGAGTDWQKEIYRTATMQNHNLSVSGGSDKSTYYLSGNYFNQEGIIKNSGLKKYIFNANMSTELSQKLTLNVTFNASSTTNNAAVNGATHNEFGGVIYSALYYDPTEAVKDANGNYTLSSNVLLPNPVTIYKGISNEIVTTRIFGTAGINYEITNGLVAKYSFGTDLQNARRDIYNSTLTLLGQAYNGLAMINTLNRSNSLHEFTLNYSQKTNDNRNALTVLGGVTYQNFLNKGYAASASDFPTDVLGANNLSLGSPGAAVNSSFKEGNSLLSYLARVNYSFDDEILLTASMRADGSSRFGSNNKYGFFPSFAVAWKLDDKNFIPDFFKELKLRASYGVTGNQEIPNYSSLTTFTPSGSAILEGTPQTSTSPARLSNPDLKWESTAQTNIGIDAAILGGRLSASLDFFVRNTRDMLINLPVPLSSGYASKLQNIGKMKNSGIELALNSKNITASEFSWNTSLNFSTIKNKVTDIGGLKYILMGNVPEANQNGTITQVGLPLNSYYGYNIIGIFKDQDQIDHSAQKSAKPGYPIFEDVDNSGAINDNDRKVLGSPFPDFIYGLGNTFRYKNISLDILFNGQYGNQLLNATEIGFMYPSNFRRNRSERQIKERWSPDNADGEWPSGVNTTAYGGGKISNLVVENASFLRLQSVQLSYFVPVKNASLLKSLRVSASGQNIFTITNYSGTSPDANVYGQTNYQIDFTSYPMARIWTISLNASF